MSRKLCLIIVFSIGIHFGSFAQDYFNDSLVVGLGIYNTPVLHHPVRAGQTIYGLSKYYQISVEAIQRENPNLIVEGLGVDKNVRIPVELSSFFLGNEGTILYCVVEKGESLFSIARRKFNIPLAVVVRMNELTSDHVSFGQVLKLGIFNTKLLNSSNREKEIVGTTPENDEDEMRIESFRIVNKSLDQFEALFMKQSEGNVYTTDRGVAFWNKESAIRKGNYVLHKTAPVNSIVEITNPMFGVKVYGKVIGTLPPGTYTDDVKVVISPSMAKNLRARDSRFFSYVTYISN